MSGIVERIDAALDKARWRELQPRWLYLTVEDHDELDASQEWQGFKCSVLTWRDLQIRRGGRSMIVAHFGVCVAVPKRLSPRVRAPA